MELSFIEILTTIFLVKHRFMIYLSKQIIIIGAALMFFLGLPRLIFGQELEISFYPSFHANSISLIECTNDSCRIMIEIFNGEETSSVIWSEENKVPAKECITLFDYFKDDLILKDSIFAGLDGIIISGKYKNGSKLKHFKFWSPLKGTIENDFFNEYIKVFHIMTESRKTERYLKVLKKYN